MAVPVEYPRVERDVQCRRSLTRAVFTSLASASVYVSTVCEEHGRDGGVAKHGRKVEWGAGPGISAAEAGGTPVVVSPLGSCGHGGGADGEEEFGGGEVAVVSRGVKECPAVFVGDLQIGRVRDEGGCCGGLAKLDCFLERGGSISVDALGSI